MPPRKPRKRPALKVGEKPLEEYQKKRDFSQTTEPVAKIPRESGNSFVVQEHHARSHHFDFRLEIDGVLVSWAVPKGIPETTGVKRLAVHVEDHPIAYGSFEGEIPKGNYGAGNVAIWDAGVWVPEGKDQHPQVASGHLKFFLQGERLRGLYLLTRMAEEPNWLLQKLSDEEVPIIKTLGVGDRLTEVAHYVAPQLAHAENRVPVGDQWFHELKYDGYRLIAVKRGKSTQLFTRSGLDWSHRFERIAHSISQLSHEDFVLDGEAIVVDEQGRSDFGELQQALTEGDGDRIRFVVFDLLHLAGRSLRDQAFTQRAKHLAELVGEEDEVVFRSRVWTADQGGSLFKQACTAGLEGVISKQGQGTYRSGNRKDWVKSKCRTRQEFVIFGFTRSKDQKSQLGTLVLGSFEDGHAVPRGKVGTGFSETQRRQLVEQLSGLPSTPAPFVAGDSEVTWVKPVLVAEIQFAELTRSGSIRHGSFLGLREDKLANEVQLESASESSGGETGSRVLGTIVTHPERLVFPRERITKLEVVEYYAKVGELLLPWVANRPLALLRAPDGISGQTFFQKSFSQHLPKGVHQMTLDDGTHALSIRNVDGLVQLAQFGVIEFHPWGARLDRPERPDLLIWDLDPDDAVPWNEVLGAALFLRDHLADLGFETFVKVSGGKGLHLMMRIRRDHDWDVMRPFTKVISQRIAASNPQRFIISAGKAKRGGKIFIDWMRNGRGATCVAPWSLRARTGAPVSMPISWSDLRDVTADGFTLREPAQTPLEWVDPPLQTIPKSLLRDLRLI